MASPLTHVSPGPIDTELVRSGKTVWNIERMQTMAASDRSGETDDTAGQVVLFLVTDAARWINGQ